MRITTQMINEGARKAGLPIHGNSLLDYIKTDCSNNSLLNTLNKNNNNATVNQSVSKLQKNNFEKLEKSAENLQEKAEKFLAEGNDSLFAKAAETKDTQQIYDTVKSLMEQYNNTIKNMKSASSPLNDYYKQMFEEIIGENKEALGTIGISSSREGLMLDETKMKSASLEDIEKALGSKSTFSAKVAYIASRVSANAQTNMESVSSTYGSTGDIYSAINSKFDLWG